MANKLKIFFISDIVGEPGLNLLETMFPPLRDKYKPDFIIANAENSHEGRGINRDIVARLYAIGVDVITGGNHSFDKWKIFPYMKTDERLLRPMNYPRGNAGYGYGVYGVNNSDAKIGVLNLQGRTFMPQIDDPFTTAEWVLERIKEETNLIFVDFHAEATAEKLAFAWNFDGQVSAIIGTHTHIPTNDASKEETNLIFVDFHAEATAEKLAFAWNFDGQVSAIIGTHTHIPTNDARILPKGTGYLTDAGMTGPFDSVIGMDKGTSIRRFTMGTPQKYKIADKDNRICGVHLELDTQTAKCTFVEPVIFPEFNNKL